MRRFELVRGLTRRFWHVSVEGQHVTVTTGVAGTPTQPLTASFPTPQAALAEQERLVKERLGWGYVELESAPPLLAASAQEAPPAAPDPPAPAPPASFAPDEAAAAAAGERAARAARAAVARKS